MRLELRLLGRFAASLAGSPPRLVQISAPRRRALLAYLAMQPAHAETRERLADLLWGHRFDKQARQSLRQALAQLRKELEPFAGDVLVFDRDTVGLKPDRIWVDARELLALNGAGDPAAVAAGLALYRGALLDGLDLDAEAYGDWVRAERTRIKNAAARLFEGYAVLQDKAGAGAAAVGAAERLVALDPGAERAQRLLLTLAARHAGRDAALARADAALAYLRRELDAAPEDETKALIERIRRGEIPPAPRAPGVATAAAAPAPRADPAPARPRARLARVPRMLRPWIGAGSLIGIAGLAALAVMVLAGDQPLAVATSAKTADITRPPFPNQGISLVVVLPFTGEGEERSPGQLVADRVTDDLINDLSSMPGIRVISRATSRLYKGRAVDVAAIGREIGVRYVVEGSVRVQGGTLRINVALTEAATRVQVWTERFERDQSDRFAVQDEIARSLARRLHVTVLTNEDRRRTPTDPAIDALLAKGWAAMLRISEVGKTGSADSYFEEVLKRDPDNVSALTGLGAYHAGVVARFQVADPEPHLARAEAALARAVKLNPRASLAHYFNGIAMKSRGRPQDALAAFERTLALNPSYAPAYAQTGHVLYRIGRLGEAIEYVRYAVRLSPRDPNLGLWSLFAGEIELELGHDEKALDWLNGALASDPKNPFMPAALAALYALRGDKAAAARYVEDTKKLAPWLTPERMIERLVGLSTKGSEPRRLLQGLRQAFGRPS